MPKTVTYCAHALVKASLERMSPVRREQVCGEILDWWVADGVVTGELRRCLQTIMNGDAPKVDAPAVDTPYERGL